jgi:hypothetical protein
MAAKRPLLIMLAPVEQQIQPQVLAAHLLEIQAVQAVN